MSEISTVGELCESLAGLPAHLPVKAIQYHQKRADPFKPEEDTHKYWLIEDAHQNWRIDAYTENDELILEMYQ